MLAQRLARLTREGSIRRVRPSYPDLSHRGTVCGGVPCVSFASNDYLGLSTECPTREPVQGGATGSRLLSGAFPDLLSFESAFASWLGYDTALMGPSGYQVNVGVLSSVLTPDDVVFVDKSIHASLWDGIRLSGAQVVRFPHGQVEALAQRLREHRHKGQMAWLVVEALYSMDGDWAPLTDMVALAKTHGCGVVVDEAHSLGIVGPEGRGWVAAHGLQAHVDIWLGAFGKAWGSAGGIVATSTDWMTWLQSTARSLMFSTAPFPAMVQRNQAVLDHMPLLDERRRQLAINSQLAGGIQGAPIVSLPQTSVAKAQSLAARLWHHRLWVPVIQYPTVPRGRPRLRLSVSACHDPADIQRVMALYHDAG